MKHSFLKEEKIGLREQITFIGKELKIYIPSYFFDDEISFVVGDMIQSLGLYTFETDNKFYDLRLPVNIYFGFSEKTKKKLKLKPGMPEIEYDIFILKTNDIFVYDIMYKQSTEDIMNFLSKMIEGAKLPPTLPYNEIYNIFLSALITTGLNTGLLVSSLSLEFLVSELARSRRNLNVPYRMVYNSKDPYNYKLVRITKIPELQNTLASISGEDLNQQIVSSVVRTRSNAKETKTPIEKMLKY